MALHVRSPGDGNPLAASIGEAACGLRRNGQAGDQPRLIAGISEFYASEEAEFITGTTLLVDGGMTAGYLQRERSPQARS